MGVVAAGAGLVRLFGVLADGDLGVDLAVDDILGAVGVDVDGELLVLVAGVVAIVLWFRAGGFAGGVVDSLLGLAADVPFRREATGLDGAGRGDA